ncbi:TPA: MBL fold metallo-hydrolase [Candidatus Micrarchaeota archaeon]|nr:MBL fold metallo-hydrolase [Candidatus Micrarchaeota archaeon]
MRLTFYGGAEEVGRSCVLLEEGKKNLMFDCGIKLGEKTEYPLLDDSELRRVRNVAVSHAHLDHSGYLPHVYFKKAKPKVFLTKPTRDLMGVLLPDYYRLHRGERGTRKLFRQKDVDDVLRDANMLEYGQEGKGDFTFGFHRAGHIMGSGMIHVKDGGGVLYTGDICTRKTRILDPCDQGIKAKTLICESTYGGKDDILPSYKEASQKMVSLINKTLDRGGHVVIPSFAVGRAQEVLMILDDYMRSGALRNTKIYIEGMIGKVMRIYRHNAIDANDDIKRRILMSEDDPFKSPAFAAPKSKKRDDVLKEPCIIVSTSGMLSGGPVMFYLEKLAGNPKNTMIFVGYQAPGTRGRKVLEGQKHVMVGEKEIEIKMQVERVRISGHADYNELLQFIKGMKGLKKIFLMHGEKTDLKDALEKDYEVVIPRTLETYAV